MRAERVAVRLGKVDGFKRETVGKLRAVRQVGKGKKGVKCRPLGHQLKHLVG